ncbi:MAG: dTDP-4-dehydrorhamnose reductase [Nitrospirae bacterium]|nr:dTDP-4-dehydrorhamnose reductase [Nitrospirota bacterium]
MRVLITGASGMLGTDLVRKLAGTHEIVPLSSKEMDITREEETRRVIREAAPQAIVHAAAFTRVDDCEKERDKAFRINGDGTRYVALGARDTGARLLTISTDYVFDGKKEGGYREEDPTAPLGVYGQSKLAGEEAVREILEDSLILRTSWLFGRNGPNFVKTILRIAREQPVLRVVHDQRGSPTYTPDLADGIARLLETPARGIVHLSNSGTCTWWEYAVEILRLTGVEGVTVLPITTAESGRPAPRPANSILDNNRYETFTGHRLRHWKEALKDYLRENP